MGVLNSESLKLLNLTNGYNVAETIIKVITIILLIVGSFSDIRTKRISILFPCVQFFVSVIYSLYGLSKGTMHYEELLLSFVPGILLLIISFISRQGVGIGDGLMVLAIGPVLGMADMLLATLIGFTLSSIVGGILLIMRRVNGKSTMAFIPFLTAGVGVMSFAFI